MSDVPLKYEMFIRKAFAFAKNSSIIKRAGDPAELAEAGFFTDANIDKIKSVTSYASVILTRAVINNLDSAIDNSEYVKLNGYCSKIIKAQSIKEISELITDIESSVIDYYFIHKEGKLTLK